MWPFKKQLPAFGSPPQKIEIFSRHCFFSPISQHKKRFPHFSREKCFQNLLETTDFSKANLNLILDTKLGNVHFLLEQSQFPVLEIQEGTEAGAFLRLLEIVEKKNFHPETILYFVEDDYLHRPGWLEVLLEGMNLPDVGYVTLFDHKDKYLFPDYKELRSKLFITPSSHWRTTPSTTQTFAVRWKRLQKDLKAHRKFSLNRKISRDHEKFLFLAQRGATLISSIPGKSTHVEVEFASPCVNWEFQPSNGAI